MIKYIIALLFILGSVASAGAQQSVQGPHGTWNSIANLTGSVALSTTTTIGTMPLPQTIGYPEACTTTAEFQLCSASGTTATVVVGVSNPEGPATCTALHVPFDCCTGNGTPSGAGTGGTVCHWGDYPMSPYIGVVHSTRNLTLVSGGNSSTGANCQDITIVRMDVATQDATVPPIANTPIVLPNGTNGSSIPLLALSVQNSGGTNSLTYAADAWMSCVPATKCLRTSGCSGVQ